MSFDKAHILSRSQTQFPRGENLIGGAAALAPRDRQIQLKQPKKLAKA